MTSELTASKSEMLAAAYHRYDCDLRYRYLFVGLIISMIGVPAGFTLDYLIYPDRVGEFFAIRMGVVAALAVILVLLYLSKNLYNSLLLKIYSVLTVLIINMVFCLMIFFTNGPKSPYYAGISIILAAFSTLKPWNVAETFTACLATYDA